MEVEIKYDLIPLTPVFIKNKHSGSNNSHGAELQFKIPGSTIKGRTRYCCKEFIYNCTTTVFEEEDITKIFSSNGNSEFNCKNCVFSDLTMNENCSRQALQKKITGLNDKELSKTKMNIPLSLLNKKIIFFKKNSKLNGKIVFKMKEEDNKYIALVVIGLR